MNKIKTQNTLIPKKFNRASIIPQINDEKQKLNQKTLLQEKEVREFHSNFQMPKSNITQKLEQPKIIKKYSDMNEKENINLQKKEIQYNSLQKRHDNSLSILTRRFMKLIKSEVNKTIDLNQASTLLGVQKRRIYDITNVLEGINYVIKISKNKLQWIGPTGNENKENQLQIEINKLIKEELFLEKMLMNMQGKIKYLKQKEQKYCYLNPEDIVQVGNSLTQNLKTLLIKTPKNSKIQIKEFEKCSKNEEENQIQSNVSMKKICIKRGNVKEEKKTDGVQNENQRDDLKIKVYSIQQISSLSKDLVKQEE